MMANLCPSVVLLAGLLAASVQLRAVDGAIVRPLEPSGAANLLLFIASDCPVANGYAPDIQRICTAYARNGVNCLLVYEDVGVTAEAVRKHLSDYRYVGVRAVVDADGQLARRLGASVTPEAAVVDRDGKTRYRGRIDDRYVALGRQRRTVTSHDLQAALDLLVAGKPVAIAQTTAIGCFIVPPDLRRN